MDPCGLLIVRSPGGHPGDESVQRVTFRIGVSPQVIARLLPCPLHGLDVPQAKITAWVISAEAAGKTNVKLAEFGGFQRDRQALAQWLARFAFEFV